MARGILIFLAWALVGGEPAMSADGDTTSDGSAASAVRGAHLRVARATDHLDQAVAFYRDGLGFEVIASFDDHEGFDGVMLGHPGAGYHLELTRQRGHQAGRAPNKETLLVFYLPDPKIWQAAVDRMVAKGYPPVKSWNPYWEQRGKTFEDVDGYRVVLQNAAWD